MRKITVISASAGVTAIGAAALIASGACSLLDAAPRKSFTSEQESFLEDLSRRVPDTRKIEALIGWRPALSLRTILEEVVAWVRAHADHAVRGNHDHAMATG